MNQKSSQERGFGVAILTRSQCEQYQEEGFFLARRLFAPEKITAIKDWVSDIAAHREEYPPALFILEDGAQTAADPLAAVRKIQQLHLQPRSLEFFGPDSRSAAIASELIGSRELRYGSSCFTKPASHGSETPWHQDQMLWAIWTPTAVSCWVALDTCTAENGCLQFVRGSHNGGIVEHVSTPETKHPHIPKDHVPRDRVVLMEMEPGDAVFFGGRMWHHSEPNRSPHRRLGIVAVYNSEAEYQATRHIASWVNHRRQLDMGIGEQKKTLIQVGASDGRAEKGIVSA